MRKIYITVFLFFALFFSCKNSQHEKTSNEKVQSQSHQPPAKPGSSNSDTLIITSTSAVFYRPDSIQLEKIRQVNGKSISGSMEHDCFYQMRNARNILRSAFPHIKIVETQSRFLLFLRADKYKTLIDLNTKYDQCGLFLFNLKKDPALVDMMNIETALADYFNK